MIFFFFFNNVSFCLVLDGETYPKAAASHPVADLELNVFLFFSSPVLFEEYD